MALRFIEVIVPLTKRECAERILEKHPKAKLHKAHEFDKSLTLQTILAVEDTECFMDDMQKEFSQDGCFRMVLIPLEAVLPRMEEVPKVVSNQGDKPLLRVSREELLQDVSGHTRLSPLYLLMVFLSSIVVTVGILYENTAAVIGAMVIAPLLGPNVAMSFATTLGDLSLARKAVKVNLVGIAIALGLAFVLGQLLPIKADNAEILIRTQARAGDAVLALAAGCAATLAFTSGAPGALIGVMVAVALLPPIITIGLMLAAGRFQEAYGGGLLFLTNLICINLSSVLTFWAQGIRPLNWWEAGKAQKATAIAACLWGGLFVVLFILIWLSKKTG